MPVSKEFMDLFTELLRGYETAGKGTYVSRGDSHYERFVTFLSALKPIIQTEENYNDRFLLNYLSYSAQESLTSDPIFSGYLHQFIIKLKEIASTPQKSLLYGIPGKADYAEMEINWVKDLNKSILLLTQSHTLQINVLNQQIYHLTEENLRIISENEALHQRIQQLEKYQEECKRLKQTLPLFDKITELVRTEQPLSNPSDVTVASGSHQVRQTLPPVSLAIPTHKPEITKAAPPPVAPPPPKAAPKVCTVKKPENFLDELRRKTSEQKSKSGIDIDKQLELTKEQKKTLIPS